jgi:hypothetical protein
MTKIVKLTESDLTKIVKMVMEQAVHRDKWGRSSLEKGKPSLWYGFDPKLKKWVQGPCKGITTQDGCRSRLGMKTRSKMSAKEEAITYKPKTSKVTPWPIQINYYRPMDKKFPTGHIECRSLREPQYQMNANPIRNNWVEAITSTQSNNKSYLGVPLTKTDNFWNMPMTGKSFLPDKPKNATTIYVYLTDKEYGVFKKATPKLNLKLDYKADKLAQETKSPQQAIKNYNVLTQNCADGVAKTLGVSVKGFTKTEALTAVGVNSAIITFLGPLGLLVGPAVAVSLAAIDNALDITLPYDVFEKIKEVYKGRWTTAAK